MRTEIPGVDWLLDCEPRPAQLEALARSYTGYCYRDHQYDEPNKRPLPHAGNPIRGWCMFMEMRVGKTPTLLNEFMLFKRDYGIKRAVIFAPNKYKNTWVTEANRFGIDIPCLAFDSSSRSYVKKWTQQNDEFMLFVHYEATLSDESMAILESVVDRQTYLGADESAFIKRHDSIYTKRLLHLASDAGVTRPMSGKPAPQGPHDLYSQLRFAHYLEGVNFYAFRARHCLLGGFKGKRVVGIKNEEKLDELLAKTSFRAMRRDWGTKIDSDYETVKLEMAPAQKQAYNTMENEFMVWLDSGDVVTVDQVISKHMKLQQISSGFIIDEYGQPNWLLPFEKTPKFMDLKDRVENYLTGKIIVIAHYTETINALMKAFDEFQPAVIMGNRGMKIHGRETDDEKNRFNNDPKCRMIIGQSKAIKYGHTLMAQPGDPCSTTAFFENSYSLDDRAQCEERNQGEGQVSATHMLDYYSSMVEQIIIGALQKKEDIAAKIMGYYKGE